MKTLEVLIPTYKRPESASQLLECLLSCADERLSIRCNSNCFEPSLEKYRNRSLNLTYDCFEKNKGIHGNYLKLFQSAEAKYCLIMSDEDRLDLRGIPRLLDYLDNLSDSVAIVICAVCNTIESDSAVNTKKRMIDRTYNLGECVALDLIPSYMTGVIFSTNRVRNLDLDTLTKPVVGNAYVHLNIALEILANKDYLVLYTPRCILKGKDVTVGGEGYSHRMYRSDPVKNNLDLNPFVYGPYARVRQYFYLERQLYNMRKKMRPFAYILGNINLTTSMVSAILTSPDTVVYLPDMNLKHEVKRAINEAKNLGDYSASFFAKSFTKVFFIPIPILGVLQPCLGRISAAFRKIYGIGNF